MRAALRAIRPAHPEHRRGRGLATLTVVVAAAGIAAATATSEDGGDRDTVPATVAGTDVEVPRTEADPATGDPDDAAPRASGPGPTEAPMGEVERLSDQRSLPNLSIGVDDSAGASDAGASSVPPEPQPDPQAQPDRAPQPDPEPQPEPVYEAADGERIDADRVFSFLDGRDAPLAAHADTIVAAGIEHDVDPRVVVAIAIAESNGAEMKPAGTHNAWGWGGSGPRGLRAWSSWEESIDDFTARLGALYDTDNVDWDFASTYCPPNTQWWHDTVTWAINQI